MMNDDGQQKINSGHLQRNAYLYIRQSTLHQVFENTESTKRQYALRQRAIALGWPIEQVIVIDNDQGQSGALENREGFQKLVAEVGMGQAGLVMGLEVSRLARNSVDWHRLLQICHLTKTLILDEDGLYDPCNFNDRILLGLKGTMSEAELHILQARLQGGIRSKAQRGELRLPLPVGFIYDPQGKVILDPDRQVQKAIHIFFQTYQRIGSAWGVVRFFRDEGFSFPRRLRCGINKDQLIWGQLRCSRALQMLHNPRYAGAFVFGQTHTFRDVDGRTHTQKQTQDHWHTLILDAHSGYISWEQYQENICNLQAYAQSHGLDRKKSPPGQGPALLQGLAVCGICGQRMTLRYHRRCGQLIPDYICQKEKIEHGGEICQQILGRDIDKAIGELLVEMVKPVTLEVAWAVQQELQLRFKEADQLRLQQVERARYEADLAKNRYMQVDPNNRLVADELEADWNIKLRALAEVRQHYEQDRQTDQMKLDDQTKAKILALATDFPQVWHASQTSSQERKRMVRLLIEDVTLIKADHVIAHVRFKAGTVSTITVPLPLNSWQARMTQPEVIADIDHLLDMHTESQIASILNQRGCLSGMQRPFTPRIVANIRRRYQLKTRYERLRAAGMLTLHEMAAQLSVHPDTVRIWQKHGLIQALPYNDKNQCLYKLLADHKPCKSQGKKLSHRRGFSQFLSQATNEVQNEV